MFSDRMRRRLEQLQRPAIESTEPSRPLPADPSTADPSTMLGGEEITTESGPHWQIRQPIHAVWPDIDRYLCRRPTDDTPPHSMPSCPSRVDSDFAALTEGFPHRTVYLDLETCGFSGSMVFLIGLLHWQGGQLVLSQFWARTYAEESAILQSLWACIADNQVLVTFNGKSFDWPQIHDRSTMHHLGYRRKSTEAPSANEDNSMRLTPKLAPTRSRPEPWHVDLLHHARRRWRHQLPNCRLQTLERFICGRRRVGDLPGSEIPSAYHDYVRTGDAARVRAILHHNALDLVTLLQLSLLFRAPTTPSDTE